MKRARDLMAADEGNDDLGPIDFVVVEFAPGTSHFTGELARELVAMADAELIRVLDLVILRKSDDGLVEAFELRDIDSGGEVGHLERTVIGILSAQDIEHLSAAVDPGTIAGVVVWENTWAADLAMAVRRSGGQLVATGRIPTQAILASIEADSSP